MKNSWNLNHLQETIAQEFDSFFLTEAEKKDILNIVAFHTEYQDRFPGSHLNVLLVYADEHRMNSFVERLVSTIGRILSIDNIGARISEETLSRDPELILKKHGEKQIYVITDCSETEPANWPSIREVYEADPTVMKIVCVNQNAEYRFRKDEHIYFRVLNKRFYLREYSWADACSELMGKLKQNPLPISMTEAFISGIRDYIKTVYPKADLKEQLFVQDVFARIVQSINAEKYNPTGVELSEENIPFYRKSVDIFLDTPSAIDKSSSEVPSVTAPDATISRIDKTVEDYICDYYLPLISASKDIPYNEKEVHIGLFALSNMGNVILKRRSSLEIEGEDKSYYYQQEASIIDMLHRLGDKNLEHLILLTTDKTRHSKPDNNGFDFESSDNVHYIIDNTALEFIKIIANKIWNFSNENDGAFIKDIPVDEKSLNKPDGEYTITPQSTAKAIHDVFSYIKELERAASKSGKKVILHFYSNGGLRQITVIIESIMSLINNDTRMNITIENNNVIYDIAKSPTTTIEISALDIFDFVSGINEVTKYGKVDSLLNYLKFNDKESFLPDIQFKNCLEHISKGIQTNKLQFFLNGLSDLDKIRNNELNNNYLRLFRDTILNSFDFLDKDDVHYTIGILEWSLKRGYYQQLLTMIESLVPPILYKAKVFSFDLCDDDILEYRNKNNAKHDDIETLVFNRVILNASKEIEEKRNTRLTDYYSSELNCKLSKSSITGSSPINQKLKTFLKIHNNLKTERNASNHLHISTGKTGQFDSDNKEISTLEARIERYIEILKELVSATRSVPLLKVYKDKSSKR